MRPLLTGFERSTRTLSTTLTNEVGDGGLPLKLAPLVEVVSLRFPRRPASRTGRVAKGFGTSSLPRNLSPTGSVDPVAVVNADATSSLNSCKIWRGLLTL